jgi:N-carbamoyl-L-amino-acid hydrolase
MAAPTDNLKIDGSRLWDSLMEMAKIGPGVAGGNNRQTLTDDDAAGRALFARWCDEAGLSLGVDAMGTMFAARAGEDPDALPVDLGIRTRHPIVVTNWTNEEGARFAPAMLASGVFAGVIDRDYAYARTDPDGKTFGDELERIGWKGSEEVGARKMHAYFELHIEQGPILEAEGRDIGVVTHCQGLWWLEFTLTGREAHTGSTPMALRVNAGLAMARILEMVQEVAMSEQPAAVGGVGQMRFAPNSRNVLPGKVVFTVDIRSPDQAKLDRMRARIEERAAAICAEIGVGCAVEAVGHFDPVTFAPELVARVRSAAERLGYSHLDIVSGAGHDACWAAKVAPATMVMCPCVDGLSHNEAEEITPEWAEKGANVLFHAVLETAEIVG